MIGLTTVFLGTEKFYEAPVKYEEILRQSTDKRKPGIGRALEEDLEKL